MLLKWCAGSEDGGRFFSFCTTDTSVVSVDGGCSDSGSNSTSLTW
jgi:hypothetical protein